MTLTCNSFSIRIQQATTPALQQLPSTSNEDEQPDFQTYHSLNYLTDALKTKKTAFEKALLYYSYLEGCRFNSSYYPSRVIPFSLPGDADELVQAVRSVQQQLTDHTDSRVCLQKNLHTLSYMSFRVKMLKQRKKVVFILK